MKQKCTAKPVNKQSQNNIPQVKDCTVVIEDIMKLKRDRKDFLVKPCRVVLTDVIKNRDPNSLSTLQKQCGDGKKVKIFDCGCNKCEISKEFSPRDKVVSSCTKRIYDCITPPNTVYVDCHDRNVIYCLTCSTCGLQYVGETSQQLNARFNGHRTGIRKLTKHGTCKYLSNHFNFGVCKDSSYTVQILEKLKGTGRTARGAIDPKITSLRKSRENYWIMKLRTVYPYGLNDRCEDDYMADQNNNLIGLKFPSLKRKFQRINHRTRSKKAKPLNHHTFINMLDKILKENLQEGLNFIRISLVP